MAETKPFVDFQAIKERYAIGDDIKLCFNAKEYLPTTKDFLGVFPCEDATTTSDANSYGYIPAHVIAAGNVLSMTLKLDFATKQDMAPYEVRYITEKNDVLGKSKPFKISLVPYDEVEEGTTNEGGEITDVETSGNILEEVSRRVQAEKTVESLAHTLGKQMTYIEGQTKEVLKMKLSCKREKCMKDNLVVENRELDEHLDLMNTELKKTQTSLMSYRGECSRLSQVLETTDRENSCLKFQIVNSEERLDTRTEERISITDADAWTECQTLNNNIDLLEEALEGEREKTKLVEEELLLVRAQYAADMEINNKAREHDANENEKVKNSLRSVTELVVDDIEKVCGDSVVEMEKQCRVKIEGLKSEVEAMDTHEETLCALKLQHDVDTKDAKKELEAAQQKCVDTEREIAELKVTMAKDKVDASIFELRVKLEEEKRALSEELEAKKESDKSYEKTIDELESRVVNESTKASRFENDLAIAEMRCKESDEDVKFFRQQLLETEKKLQNGQTMLSKTLEEMNNLKNTMRCSGRSNNTPSPVDSGVWRSKSDPSLSTNQSPANSPSCNNISDVHASTPHPSTQSTCTANKPSTEQQRIPGIINCNQNLHQVSPPENSPKVESPVTTDEQQAPSPQPISAVVPDQQRQPQPKKGRGRRFSKPINLATFTPMSTLSETESEQHHHHQQHQQQQQHIIGNFSREVNNLDRPQLENQYDAIRQHRNSLLRENTYLKNKVSSLVTDLVLLQKNLQEVINDAEQKVTLLHLVLGNQYLAAMTAQNMQNCFSTDPTAVAAASPFPLIEPNNMNFDNSTDNVCSPSAFMDDFGVVHQTPIKNVAVNEPRIVEISAVKEKPVLSSCSSNFLSPHAEEYTPCKNRQPIVFDDAHSIPSPISSVPPPPEATTIPTNCMTDIPPPDVFMNGIVNNTQTPDGYMFPFVPPPFPPTPLATSEESLLDVSQQLVNIGINF